MRLTQLQEAVRLESELIKTIRAMQNSMRAIGAVPHWTNFVQTRGWPGVRDQLDGAALRKFKAWWDLIALQLRDRNDNQTLQYAVALLVKERSRRSYSKEVPVKPEAFGITDSEHAGRVRDWVLTNYESLNPDLALGS